MNESVAEEYDALQQTAVRLDSEQSAAQALTHALHSEFVATMTQRDALIAGWRAVLQNPDADATQEMKSQCDVFARDVRDLDARLSELTTLRYDVRQYRRHLRGRQSRAVLRVVRARRRLDDALFENPPVAEPRVAGTRGTRALFHDMREHLTVAVLAAGKLTIPTSPERTARYQAALIRGLTDLTEDLDALDPPGEVLPSLLPVAPPIPVPPAESAFLPGI